MEYEKPTLVEKVMYEKPVIVDLDDITGISICLTGGSKSDVA